MSNHPKHNRWKHVFIHQPISPTYYKPWGEHPVVEMNNEIHVSRYILDGFSEMANIIHNKLGTEVAKMWVLTPQYSNEEGRLIDLQVSVTGSPFITEQGYKTAAVREIAEEIGIAVNPSEIISSFHRVSGSKKIQNYYYNVSNETQAFCPQIAAVAKTAVMSIPIPLPRSKTIIANANVSSAIATTTSLITPEQIHKNKDDKSRKVQVFIFGEEDVLKKLLLKINFPMPSGDTIQGSGESHISGVRMVSVVDLFTAIKLKEK
jgi:hypothetical protein